MEKYDNETLNEREGTHGDFALTAQVSCDLWYIIFDGASKSEVKLSPVQHESMRMICVKLARIISGNPNEPDHWKDISGYADLARSHIGRE